MKFVFLVLVLFLASCTSLTVYKLGTRNLPDMQYEFVHGEFHIMSVSEKNNYYSTDVIKNKIVLYLNSIGYNASSETVMQFPRYVILFNWDLDSDEKESVFPMYKSETITRSSGSGYSDSGGFFNYNGTSTTSGTVEYIPYSYKIYKSSLSVSVFDTKEADNEKALIWSARTFFCGDKAKNIDEAVDYLIPALFDRFGKPIEGRAEEYEFSGEESEVIFLQSSNKSEAFVQRQLPGSSKRPKLPPL